MGVVPFRVPRFNGAALFQSGELGQARDGGQNAEASIGPLFFRAENNLQPTLSMAQVVASMGPLFFRAENLL